MVYRYEYLTTIDSENNIMFFVSPTVDEKQKISETFALVKNSII